MRANLQKKTDEYGNVWGNDNAKHHGNSKEMVKTIDIIATYKGDIHKPITARFYVGRSSQASVVYCTVWVYGAVPGKGYHASGSGSAGGGGYHKLSAALQEAIGDAGIILTKPIAGRGDGAMNEALNAITKAMGYRGKMRVVSNG